MRCKSQASFIFSVNTACDDTDVRKSAGNFQGTQTKYIIFTGKRPVGSTSKPNFCQFNGKVVTVTYLLTLMT